jgi:GMP synthase (glutamine-hydrolysing)
MKPLLIIKTGTTRGLLMARAADFDAYILNQLPGIVDYVVAPVVERLWLPEYTAISGVVITGSPAMVTDREPWSEFTAEWLRGIPAGSLPVLGICYGHQLLAHAVKGEVGYHPQGMEIGTTEIELTAAGANDALLGAMPETFLGHVIHSQTVVKLPPGATVLARNAFEAHHAFVVKENQWGVQFHPEFNADIENACVEEETPALAASGKDVAAIAASVREHPYGQQLLQRFWELTK